VIWRAQDVVALPTQRVPLIDAPSHDAVPSHVHADAPPEHVDPALRTSWHISRSEVLLVATSVVVAAVAAAVIVQGDVVRDPPGYAVFVAYTVVAFVFAGCLWHRGRPWSPFGSLLIAFGFFLGLTSLAGSSQPLPYSIGVFVDAPAALWAWWLLLAFPLGRLDRTGRRVLWLGCAVVLLGLVPKLLVSAHIMGATPLARCEVGCPANRLLVADDPSLATVFGRIELYGRTVFALVLIATLALRYINASRPRRRVLLSVYAVAVLWLTAFLVHGFAVNVLHVPEEIRVPLGMALTGTRCLLPLGFIAAIVLARAHAGAALQSMVAQLTGGTSAAGIERVVRGALDDPSAKLAFWLPRARMYADRHGRAVALPEDAAVSSWRTFGLNGDHPVLAIVHDSALDEDPELVEAAGAAAVLALENSRLEHDLRRTVDDLRASRERIVRAGAAERRKLERDLHDSAQQRLIAALIQLELARERAQPGSDIDKRLAKLSYDLDQALDELRSIAHGIYPPLLAESGLGEALTQAARRIDAPVELDLAEVGRLPEEMETAVYFCCLEALQNSAKHGGPDVVVGMRLWSEPPFVCFTVADDGRGFVPGPHVDGTGLMNMSDRIGAIGGTISVRSAPGSGTVVEGRVKP
jgi:signal transduction histidine kinase